MTKPSLFAGSVFLLAVLVGCMHSVQTCSRAFSDTEMKGKAAAYLGLSDDKYKAIVNWVDCKYYVTVWPYPVTPDTHKYLTFDQSGVIIEDSYVP